MKKMRLAILISHPIQYLTPFFRQLAAHPSVELTVYFCWDYGVKETFDAQFGREVKWDIPLLEGYNHVFLKNFSWRPYANFLGQINPSIITKLSHTRPDALVMYGWNSCTNILACIACFFLRIPIFMRGESPLHQELLKSKTNQFMKKILFAILFKQMRAFLYIGEENKKFYEFYRVPSYKLFFAPHSIDNLRLMEESKRLRQNRAELKKELGISSECVTILFCGKLTEKKRPLDLLRSYEKVRSSHTALIFVGDGALRPMLEEYMRSHNIQGVHFVGFKNQTELPLYYSIADIFVLPSGPGETWGLVVNEAMCFNLPIVVSDMVGCAPDLVRHGENGYVFPVGDIDELANALEDLIGNPLKRTSFGAKSKDIIEGYGYTRHIQGIIDASASITPNT